MFFATMIVSLAILFTATTEAKHKSDSSDLSSDDSLQGLSIEDDTSGEETVYHDDVHAIKRDHVHKHSKGNGLRNHFQTRRWHKSCLRQASKICTKACERAYKNVCKKRKCSKRSKKLLKTECRKSCTKNFEFDKDRAAYEE